jgi:hypothetical protein
MKCSGRYDTCSTETQLRIIMGEGNATAGKKISIQAFRHSPVIPYPQNSLVCCLNHYTTASHTLLYLGLLDP